MVQLYNFLGSWQLFPEKGNYEFGDRPKSGIYKIESTEGKKEITISHNWTKIENQGYNSQYKIVADVKCIPSMTNNLLKQYRWS
jgi:hypothetical protein